MDGMSVELTSLGRMLRTWLATAVFLILAGCQSGAPGPVPNERETLIPAEQERPLFVAEAGLSSGERLRKAIDLLALGDAGQAQVELQAYLAEVGESKIANNLLRQVEAPVGDLYPEEFVEVALETGVSLSTVAKQYLGDALQFYGLARYNGITEPGKTVVGQVIKVPLTTEAKLFLASPPVDPIKSADLIDANIDSSNPVSNLLVDDEVTTQGDQAATLLEENLGLIAPEIQPPMGEADVEVSQHLTDNFGLLAGLLADKNYKAAIAEFERLDDSPGLDKATLDGVVDAYHREASQAFRRQELDTAIELWGKVMAINPDHAHASNSLMQAQELKEKLERLE